jgi:hypothetical protein
MESHTDGDQPLNKRSADRWPPNDRNTGSAVILTFRDSFGDEELPDRVGGCRDCSVVN